jgi:ribosomal protein S18 acetylase RimI-like enzyme
MTVVVRPAHTDELAAAGDLTVEAYDADGYLVPDDPYLERLRDATARARDAEVYVALLPDDPELGERPVGTVTYCVLPSSWVELAGDSEGEIRMLGVAPAARRRGVGEALVAACIERSRELGHGAVVLSSLPEQEAAHRVYGRLGFRRTPDLDWSPLPGVELLAFRLDL